MTIGDRIRKRREELGLTQEELAKKLGYASRSSVNKVEKSRELSNKKVQLYADALKCSPGYLMGWDDIPAQTHIYDFNSIDNELFEYYKENPPQTQSILNSKDKRDIAKDLNNIMQKLQSGEDGPATFDGQELSPESTELFKIQLESMLTQLKVINKEKYNPNKNKK